MSVDPTLATILHAFQCTFPELDIQGGAAEPFYQAPKADRTATLFFREDYVRSLLHEMAHYCLAGDHRRELDDFGFWYHPCGRSAAQQKQFEAAEARPQALERIFCETLGVPFQPSLDDFSGRPISPVFLEKLENAYIEFHRQMPPTATRALEGLKTHAVPCLRCSPPDLNRVLTD